MCTLVPNLLMQPEAGVVVVGDSVVARVRIMPTRLTVWSSGQPDAGLIASPDRRRPAR